MPLSHGKSKRAFEHNVKVEMDSGKPKDQALAIAYSVKRNNRKKMAKGGMAYKNDSAVTEDRPMPSERDNDAAMVSRNSMKKPLIDAEMTSRPDIKQATKGGIFKIKHPKMVPQNAYSVRMRDEEDDLEMSAKPNNGPQEQPPKRLDEEGADRQGPKVPDMQRQHNNKRKPYAEGGSIEHEMMEQPHPEADEEHEDSLIATIMARRAANKALDSGSHDEDDAAMYAEGGEIHSHDSIYSDDSDQADLSRNADEDANEEDQLSFNALRKENYSESEGLKQLSQPEDSNRHGHEIDSDDHDMVESVRRKISARRQFPSR